MSQEKRTRHAEVVLTGEFLEQISLSVQELTQKVSEHCSVEGAVLHRCRVFLQTENFALAQDIFGAGYEVIPSTDEASDLAVCALLSAIGNNPPDEIILGAGDRLSGRLLTALESRCLRTVITTKPEAFHERADTILNLAGLEIVPTDTNSGTDTSSGDDFNEEPLTEETPCLNADEIAEKNRREEEARVDRLVHSDGWQEELTSIVKKQKLSLPVLRAIDDLAQKFPEHAYLFQRRRDLLRQNLPTELRWVDESRTGVTVPMLYHQDAPAVQTVSAAQAIEMLNFGSSRSESVPEQSTPPTTTYRSQEVNFSDIAARAEVLVEACHWQKDRTKLEQAGANFQDVIRPRDEELEQRGKACGVFLWMRRSEVTLKDAQWDDLANAYDLLGKAAGLMHEVIQSKAPRPFPEQAAQIMADAVCIIKTQIISNGLELTVDYLQFNAHELLRNYAYGTKTYLYNLKINDRLEIDQRDSVIQRIANLKSQLQEVNTTKKSVDDMFKSISYHTKKIDESRSVEDGHWKKVIELVTQLCEEYRLPTSNPKLREILSKILWKLPEDADTTGTFANVVQQIETYEEEEANTYLIEPKKFQEPSPLIKAVRNYMSGAKIVWIGGTPMDHLRSRIEERFEVEMIWEECDHGDSFRRLTSVLNDPEVKLFLVYIPWCSHKHSEELTPLVRSSGKDFVRLRKGTNPEQIAAAICQQLNLE